MRDRPILFSAPMVRAILAGKKTQTRRTVRTIVGTGGVPLVPLPRTSTAIYLDQSGRGEGLEWAPYSGSGIQPWPAERIGEACPYGGPGDTLWVRETWQLLTGNGHRIVYRADADPSMTCGGTEPVSPMSWRPSIFLRREHSRINLEVTAVRVERLQAITEDDALAEGIQQTHAVDPGDGMAAQNFAMLWDRINAKRAPWAGNPWVWVVSFKVAGRK